MTISEGWLFAGTARHTHICHIILHLLIPGFSQDFMTAVSLQCKIKNHHPEWSNVSFLLLPWFIQQTRRGSNELGYPGLQHHIHTLDDAQPAGAVGQGYGAGRHLRRAGKGLWGGPGGGGAWWSELSAPGPGRPGSISIRGLLHAEVGEAMIFPHIRT